MDTESEGKRARETETEIGRERQREYNNFGLEKESYLESIWKLVR